MNNRFTRKFQIVVVLISMTILVSCKTKLYTTFPDGVIVNLQKTESTPKQSVRLQVISAGIIRVSAVPGDNFTDEKSLMIIDTLKRKADFTVSEKKDTVILKTSLVKALVLLRTGEVVFTDTTGKVILSDKQGGRSF